MNIPRELRKLIEPNSNARPLADICTNIKVYEGGRDAVCPVKLTLNGLSKCTINFADGSIHILTIKSLQTLLNNK